MNEGTGLGFSILFVASILGAAGDFLLRPSPNGLNVLLMTSLVTACTAGLILWRRVELYGDGYWMIVPLFLAAAAVAWRDSPTLQALNFAAMLIAASNLVIQSRKKSGQGAGLLTYLGYPFAAAGSAAGGALPLLFNDIDWKAVPRDSWLRQCAAVLRGLMIALPLVLIFGGLFVAADEVFGHFVCSALDLDFNGLMSHIVGAAAIAWAAAGCLRTMLLREDRSRKDAPPAPTFALSVVEVSVVLGLLDLLFLAFVVVQIRYLFGGASVVQATAGVTYAGYARSGFFQLVSVACLVLPLLLVVHHHLQRENTLLIRLYQLLAGAQVAMVLVIVTSALKRLELYSAEYGLTELRFYTTAFTVLLAVVFLLFTGTVLFGMRRFFGVCALAATFLSLFILNILNPDAWIVRANLNHARVGYMFDVPYAASLSADAVPALVEALPAFPPSEKASLLWSLDARWNVARREDWRRWNWGRASAIGAVRALVQLDQTTRLPRSGGAVPAEAVTVWHRGQ